MYPTNLVLRLGLKAICGIVCVISLGCGSAVPSSHFDERTATALGMDPSIEFRTEGEPVDVPKAGSESLALQEAVQRTLTHSPAVQIALSQVRAAQAEARQARMLPNPVLSVVFRWPESGGKPEIEAGLAADLMSILSRQGRISAADSRLRATAAGALSEVLNALAEVQERYVAVQTNEELTSVLRDRLSILDRLLQNARSRLEVGEGTQLDVLALEQQGVTLQTELTERELEGQEDRLVLARLIGEPSAAGQWQVAAWESYQGRFPSEADWVRLGLENRPEIAEQQYELAALGAELRQTQLTPFDGAEVGVEAERADGEWAFGPALATPIPLFDFGQGRRDRIRANVSESQHRLTQVRRQVVEDVRRAHAAFAASRANLQRITEELIPLAERRLKQAETQFRAGQVDVTGLLLAEEDLQSARTRRVELERRNAEALIRLQRAVGGPGVISTAATATSPDDRSIILTASSTAPTTQTIEKE